jgi:NADPH:quinone reductase-like Zn-dependent oxidoreductase
MKAVVFDRYGGPEVLRLVDLPKPVPLDNEVLIRNRATTVNSGDARLRALKVPRGLSLLVRLNVGLFGPKQPILGFDLAGEIEAVGRDVTKFKPGDRVLGAAGFAHRCHAEYRCLPEDGMIAPIPDTLTFGEAVALSFGGGTALLFLKRGNLRGGEKLLVNGASGAVGAMAVQLAKLAGAEVTAVTSTGNIELVRSLGADRVIDYTKEDFAGRGETWDVIMDTVGNAPFSRVRRSLGPGGRFLMVIGNLFEMIAANFHKRTIVPSAASDRDIFAAESLRHLLSLAQKGEIKPVIDRTYPLERIAEAHAYVDTGRKRGAVVVTV